MCASAVVTVLASFSVSFTSEKSCKTDVKSKITVSQHVYKAILSKEGKYYIYLHQVMSTGPQSAFRLTFRKEGEATGRAERLQRPQAGWQTGTGWRGRGHSWLQWEYLSNRQGKQVWQQHEYERGCFCQSVLKLWIWCVNRTALCQTGDAGDAGETRNLCLLVWGWRVW